MQDILELLHDTNRMVMQFARGIRRSSGHIYTSALPFSPPCRLKQKYGHVMRFSYVTNGVPTCWNPNYCTIDLPVAVLSVTYSSDGSMIAVGTKDGDIFVFNSVTGAEVVAFKEDEKNVLSVAFTPDGSRLASTTGNKAMVWDVSIGAPIVSLEGHTDLVKFVAFTSDGLMAITGSSDKTLGIWDSHTGNLVSRHSGSWSGCLWWSISDCFALSPDTVTIARGILDGVEIWDWQNDHPLRRLMDFGSGLCQRIQFLPGNLQLTAQLELTKALKIWDYQTGMLLKSIDIDGEIYISRFESRMVRYCLSSGELQLWDTETWSILGVLTNSVPLAKDEQKPNLSSRSSLAFSPDGSTLAFSPSTNYLEVWELCREPIGYSAFSNLLDDNGVVPDALAISADSSRVVCSALILNHSESQTSMKATLKVWDLVNGKSPKIKLCNKSFRMLTWAPDGRVFMGVERSRGEMTPESFSMSYI